MKNQLHTMKFRSKLKVLPRSTSSTLAPLKRLREALFKFKSILVVKSN